MIKSGQNQISSELSIELKEEQVEIAYGELLTALGYDWQNDPNMKDTPKRVAKMYIHEITSGSYFEEPKVTTFENDGLYSGLIFEGNITVRSLCSHHMMPFFGKAHIAYIPKKNTKIIGLSKFNRIVDWFAKRPQLQEQLTTQIHDYFVDKLQGCLGVAVMVEADHMCVRMRGVKDDSTMMTTKLSGVFLKNKDRSRDEFYQYINRLKK
jgi:GTP cyclohydrolase I